MARILSYLIRNFNNYYTLHRSDLDARAAPLDPRLSLALELTSTIQYNAIITSFPVYDVVMVYIYESESRGVVQLTISL